MKKMELDFYALWYLASLIPFSPCTALYCFLKILYPILVTLQCNRGRTYSFLRREATYAHFVLLCFFSRASPLSIKCFLSFLKLVLLFMQDFLVLILAQRFLLTLTPHPCVWCSPLVVGAASCAPLVQLNSNFWIFYARGFVTWLPIGPKLPVKGWSSLWVFFPCCLRQLALFTFSINFSPHPTRDGWYLNFPQGSLNPAPLCIVVITSILSDAISRSLTTSSVGYLRTSPLRHSPIIGNLTPPLPCVHVGIHLTLLLAPY